MDWTSVANTIGSSSVALAVIGLVARSLFTSYLEKDLEGHKVKLRSEADKEQARLSTSLQIAAANQRTRFDLLHGKRAEVIAGAYARISRTNRAARAFANPLEWSSEPSKQEKFDTLSKVGNDLHTFFSENRIYFPESTCLKFDEFYTKVRLATQAMWDDLNSEMEHRTNSWSKAWETMEKEVPPMLMELETLFRNILGAHDASAEEDV